jgi:MYXO-CTERM domain-containing protein
LPSTWRGEAISGLVVPYPGVYVAGGNITLFLQGSTPLGTQTLLIRISPGGTFDLEDAFLDPLWYAAQASITISPQGQMYRAWPCKWNLADRLCLQTSQAATVGCYDANPCTMDSWNPVSGLCANTPITCPSDGDACNGPEVCNLTTGACETDASQAVYCGDGLFCNGAETCNQATGVCVTSNAPVIDDGEYCTIDSCDEAQDAVKHTPDDDRCPSDLCSTSVCNPWGAEADPATGCVTSPRDPSDGVSCTTDSCNPATGELSHVVQAGYCLIDGGCVATGTVNPTNPCQGCVPSESVHSWTATNEGVACDDSLGCTTGDRCVTGVCLGSFKDCGAVVIDPQCQASQCTEPFGACSVVSLPDDIGCDDNDACTQSDTCKSGTCMGGSPTTCTAQEECHLAGVCDASTGVCSNPVKQDGSSCDGGFCTAGVCVAAPEPDSGADAADDADSALAESGADASGGSGGAAGPGGTDSGSDDASGQSDGSSGTGGIGPGDAEADQSTADGQAGGAGAEGGTGGTTVGGGGAGGTAGTGDGGGVCNPGQSIECTGPGACKGGQVCLPDGSGYGVCDCGDAAPPAEFAAPPDSSGCGCSLPRSSTDRWGAAFLLILLLTAARRRSRQLSVRECHE